MENFDLKLRISPSDSLFKKLIGIDVYEKLKNHILKRDRFSCQGCNYRPLDDNKIATILGLHVIEINEENPEESICNVLCKACHTTQHIDFAIEKDWVRLVNSIHSQKTLIEMCRTNAIHNSIKEDNIRYLKGDPKETLAKIKACTMPTNTKIKVIFTNNFEWDDL